METNNFHDRNEAIRSGQRVKKKKKKLLVPGCEGECMGCFFIRESEEFRRREGESGPPS